MRVTPTGLHAFCVAERLVSCNRPAMGPFEILSFNFIAHHTPETHASSMIIMDEACVSGVCCAIKNDKLQRRACRRASLGSGVEHGDCIPPP